MGRMRANLLGALLMFLISDPVSGEVLSPACFWGVSEKGHLWAANPPHSCLAGKPFSTIMIK